MENITIKIEGMEELKKNIAFYKLLAPEACRRGLKIIGLKVETYAKQMCPVDTGRLRASISTNWAGSGMAEGKTGAKAQAGDGMPEPPGEKGMVVAVGTNVFYGPYVEHGTQKGGPFGTIIMSARPYLYPAYFCYEGEVPREIIRQMKKDIK